MAETWKLITSNNIILENVKLTGGRNDGVVRYTALENATAHFTVGDRDLPITLNEGVLILVVGNTVHVPTTWEPGKVTTGDFSI